MNAESNEPHEWQSCPTGELQRMVESVQARDRSRQRRRWGGRAATAAVAVAVLIGASQFLPRGSSGYTFGGITCREALPLFKAYYLATLRPNVRDQVRLHLTECPNCSPKYEQMRVQWDSVAHAMRPAALDRSPRYEAARENDSVRPSYDQIARGGSWAFLTQ